MVRVIPQAEPMVFHPNMLPETRELAAEGRYPVLIQVINVKRGEVDTVPFLWDEIDRAKRFAERESADGAYVQWFWHGDKPA